jgi:hypothetical protein
MAAGIPALAGVTGRAGPEGNGTVKVSTNTTGMAVGTCTVTITGRVLTQTISFRVKNSSFG